jgi:hypothetical protein
MPDARRRHEPTRYPAPDVVDKPTARCKLQRMDHLRIPPVAAPGRIAAWRATALALAASLLAACGGGSEAGGHRPSFAKCEQPPGDSAYASAVREYVKGLQPRPMRFLVPIGTDSMLPDVAREELSHMQPTYLWPKDEANQKLLVDKLSRVGPWASLLVTWHGMQRVGDGSAVVRMGGHYVGGEFDGKAAPRRAIHFNCDTARWHFVRTEEERTS